MLPMTRLVKWEVFPLFVFQLERRKNAGAQKVVKLIRNVVLRIINVAEVFPLVMIVETIPQNRTLNVA